MSVCYPRSLLRTDALYNFFRFREVRLSVSRRRLTATRIADALADRLVTQGLAEPEARCRYEARVLETFAHTDDFDEASPLEIYDRICQIRAEVFGQAALDADWAIAAKKGCPFCPVLDQSHHKRRLLAAPEITVVLTQPELTPLMEADLAGRPVTVLRTLPENCKNPVLFYGEEGFLACRDLPVEAVVTATPSGFYAQALTGLWSGEDAVVYIPRGLDMTRYVPLTAKTKLNFSILAALEHDQGEQIYAMDPDGLCDAYPAYFVNIYHGGPTALPVVPASSRDFDRQLDENLTAFLGGFPTVDYTAAYFEDLVRRPICYSADAQQAGILVHSIRVKRAAGARVVQCPSGETPRQMFARLALPGTALVSNFLFFLTDKLGTLYNDLRADRPREQADAASGHLDYMLAYRDGKRIETFPLFGKTCIAKCDDGSFLFCNYVLGGGSATISGIPFRWEKEDVNGDGPVRLYTPLLSAEAEEADRDTYIRPVGAGRVNVVLLRDQVTCVREGDVLLPSVGVVLSLTKEAALPLLQTLQPLEDGYYDVSGLELTVRLDPPEEVDPQRWGRVQWAYGGGLTLIRNGVGLCDGDHMEAWFQQEGWTSPLSRQTQESTLHTLMRHPRTAIGCAENGDLLILVYSGRSARSVGADYSEMIAIARQLYPDVKTLMNGDGGGSAMLGLVHNGEFLELSCPSTSTYSCNGQVRMVNTLFYIPAEERRTNL